MVPVIVFNHYNVTVVFLLSAFDLIPECDILWMHLFSFYCVRKWQNKTDQSIIKTIWPEMICDPKSKMDFSHKTHRQINANTVYVSLFQRSNLRHLAVHCSVIRSQRFGSLQWRHNDHDGVSNHQPHGCLLNRLFRRRSKKTSKLRVTGLCVGNSPGTGEFPARMASNTESVSIWWRHHV